MTLDGPQETRIPPQELDPNCVSCMYEQHERLEATARMLGVRYQSDAVLDQLKRQWPFPTHPKPCKRHLSNVLEAPPSDETTRMRAVRVPETPPANTGKVHPPRQSALSRPLSVGQAPEQHHIRASLPSGDLRAIRESGRNQWRMTGPLVPSESGKYAVPAWLLGATNSTPLFAKPQPLTIHKQQCPDCVGGTVYEPDGSFAPCARCKRTGWIEPEAKPDASVVAERYRLMAPPADRAAPAPLAAQPPQTGAMPALPAPPARKLNSGEFPMMNAALLRVSDALQRLMAWYVAFRTEAPPYVHDEIKTLGTLADNISTMSEGCSRAQALHLQGIASSLRWASEYLHRAEQDILTLSKDVEEARNAS